MWSAGSSLLWIDRWEQPPLDPRGVTRLPPPSHCHLSTPPHIFLFKKRWTVNRSWLSSIHPKYGGYRREWVSRAGRFHFREKTDSSLRKRRENIVKISVSAASEAGGRVRALLPPQFSGACGGLKISGGPEEYEEREGDPALF